MSKTSARTRTATLVVAAFALLGAVGCLPEEHQQASLDLVNSARSGNHLPALAWDSESATKAQHWAEYMATQFAISHSNLSDGITGNWTALGENVGVGPGIDAVHRGFMNSPRHRAAILSSRYRSMGIGIAVRNGMVFIAQEFRA